MSSPTLLSVIIISLQLLTTVLGADYLCKDFVVDAVAFEEDRNMYFFTSGKKYWFLKDSDLPAQYSQGQSLPEGVDRVDAAVMIDGISGCRNAKTGSAITGKSDKYIWIVATGADGQKKVQAFDAIKREFVDELKDYNTNDCIGRAKVEWEKTKGPIDAMFAISYLYVFVVQNKRYAMVDCSFICSDPKAIGKPYDPRSVRDFGVSEGQKVHAMTKMGKRVLMFHSNTFFELDIKGVGFKNTGQLSVYKVPKAKNTLQEFLRVKEPGECESGLPVASDEPTSEPKTGGEEQTSEQTSEPKTGDDETTTKGKAVAGADSGSKKETKPSHEDKGDDSSSSAWIIIVVVVIIFAVVAMAVIAFFVVSKGKSSSGAGKSGMSRSSAAPRSSMNAMPSQVTGAQSVRSNIQPSSAKSSVAKSSVKPSMTRK